MRSPLPSNEGRGRVTSLLSILRGLGAEVVVSVCGTLFEVLLNEGYYDGYSCGFFNLPMMQTLCS